MADSAKDHLDWPQTALAPTPPPPNPPEGAADTRRGRLEAREGSAPPRAPSQRITSEG
eukprot:gene11905-20939_t